MDRWAHQCITIHSSLLSDGEMKALLIWTTLVRFNSYAFVLASSKVLNEVVALLDQQQTTITVAGYQLKTGSRTPNI